MTGMVGPGSNARIPWSGLSIQVSVEWARHIQNALKIKCFLKKSSRPDVFSGRVLKNQDGKYFIVDQE
jgi:phage terminase large subunit-like protein